MKINFTRPFLKTTFLLALLSITTVTYTNQSGPGAGLAGSPVDGNCTSCHSGSPVSSGTAYDAISLSGIPAGGYAPGTTYTVTFNGSTAATAKNGFQIVALTSANANAGSLTAGTGQQSMLSGGRTYLGHTSGGTSQSSWTFSWTAPSPAVGTVTFYAALNATNSNNASTGDVIYLKSFSFNAGNLPVATITSPLNGAVFCVGDSVQFTGTATNSPTSYAWDFLGNVPNASTLQNPKVPMTSAGFKTIRFRATNSSGTSTNATISIQVVAKPSATISGSNLICGSDSVTLSANTGTGLQYLWSPGNQTTPSIKVGSAGSYSVKVTNSSGCFTNSTPFVVGTGTKPVITYTTTKDSICIGDSIGINVSPAGLVKYKYIFGSTGADSSSSNSKTYRVNSDFQTLTVVGSNASCSSDPVSKNLYIRSRDAAPVIACGPVNPTSITFDISGSNPQISLDSGKTYMPANNGSTHVITGLAPNTQVKIYARTNTAAPCLVSLSSNKVCATANCTPLTLNVSSPKYYCDGDAENVFVVRVLGTNAVNPYYSYDSPPIIGIGFSKRDTFVVPSMYANVVVKVIDSANAYCGTKDTTINFTHINQNISVTLTPRPTCSDNQITINPGSLSSSIDLVKYYTQVGTTKTLFASKFRSDGFTYGPVPATSFGNGTLIVLRGIDTLSGCGVNANTNYTYTNNPSVGYTYSKTNLQLTLMDTSNSVATRKWVIDGDTMVSGAAVYMHTFTSGGAKVVTLIGYTTNGCSGSNTQTININATGLLENQNQIGLNVYPNPANDYLVLSWNGIEKAQVQLLDIQGKEMLNVQAENGQRLSVHELPNGIYLLNVITPSGIARQKIMIE